MSKKDTVKAMRNRLLDKVEVKLDPNPADRALIVMICDRYVKYMKAEHNLRVRRPDIDMDLAAVHLNGCPMNLAKLLAADDFNLVHDMTGIVRHLDRKTGKLWDHFLPRFHA